MYTLTLFDEESNPVKTWTVGTIFEYDQVEDPKCDFYVTELEEDGAVALDLAAGIAKELHHNEVHSV